MRVSFCVDDWGKGELLDENVFDRNVIMDASAIPPYTVPNLGANVCWQVNIIEAFCLGYGKELLLDSIEANLRNLRGPSLTGAA